MAHKCYAKIVIFLFWRLFLNFLSDFFSDFLANGTGTSSEFLFDSPYNETHISRLFSPCTTSIFKNSPWLPETEPNSQDIKKETKNFRGSESVGNYWVCRSHCVTLLCHSTIQLRIECKYAWKNVHCGSEPVRKELLSQWVFVYIWNATKIKCRLFLLFLEGFFFS